MTRIWIFAILEIAFYLAILVIICWILWRIQFPPPPRPLRTREYYELKRQIERELERRTAEKPLPCIVCGKPGIRDTGYCPDHKWKTL